MDTNSQEYLDKLAELVGSEEIELPADLQPQKTELINGQALKVGTLDEFINAHFSKPTPKVAALIKSLHGVILGVEKFKTSSSKFYRLIWIAGDQAWLAAEDTTNYSKKILAWAAGEELAAATDAFFDERTRSG